jgi:hypothetical protein
MLWQNIARPEGVPPAATIEIARAFGRSPGFEAHLEATIPQRFVGGRWIAEPVSVAFGGEGPGAPAEPVAPPRSAAAADALVRAARLRPGADPRRSRPGSRGDPLKGNTLPERPAASPLPCQRLTCARQREAASSSFVLLEGGLWVALDTPHRLIPTPIVAGTHHTADRGGEALRAVFVSIEPLERSCEF